ncbi:MAG: uL15 family ribosomal protein [Clostridia bacterium]|nr:uL15 family ribosomal protein [Clostridia bacterium]
MKRGYYLFLTLVFILAFLTFGASAEEPENKNYSVRYDRGEYVLEYAITDGTELFREKSLGALLSSASGGSFHLENLKVYENIDVPQGEYIFTGAAFFEEGASLSVRNGSTVEFSNFTLELLSAGASLDIFGGQMTLRESAVTGVALIPITVNSKDGGALTLLGKSSIQGTEYDIVTSCALNFSKNGSSYTGDGELKVQYTAPYLCADDILMGAENLDIPVSLYDREGKHIPICKIRYISGARELFTEYKLSGELAENIKPEQALGYEASAWSCIEKGGEPYDFSRPVESDMTFYSDMVLIPPSFSVDDVKRKYDGKSFNVSLGGVNHPLMKYGVLEYEWYKDGELISREASISLKNVSDSGEYGVCVTFVYDGKKRAKSTERFTVTIAPKTLRASFADGRFKIDEGLVEKGDSVNLYQYEYDGYIYSNLDNSNYCLEFSPQIVKKDDTQALTNIFLYIIICAGCLLVGFVIFLFFISKRLCISSVKITPKDDDAFLSGVSTDNVEKSFFAINSERADELLSDRLAKTMEVRSRERIATSGSERAEVTVGEISDAFDDGEQVDVNSLKEKGLISGNVSYIRITEGGSLCKSLTVYANSFDIRALKMIVLSGGEAIRIKSGKI